MSSANQIINSQSYIDNIFNTIKVNWPELFNYIKTNPLRHRISDRNHLVGTIGYEGVKTYDGIIKHIIKNEDKLDWWIL